jgi:SAM-dependent methyltransferase
MRNLKFLQADGMALPFRTGSFDLVLSHAVIEHVPDAMRYLQECRRVMAPDGRMYLSTAPYLSFAGAHLPRLLVPVPLHWIFGRDIAFRTFRWLARRAPWTLQEPAHENSFIRDARQGIVKHDDLLEKVRVQRLRAQNRRGRLPHRPRAADGERHRQAPPSGMAAWLRDSALTQDYLLSNIEYVLGSHSLRTRTPRCPARCEPRAPRSRGASRTRARRRCRAAPPGSGRRRY